MARLSQKRVKERKPSDHLLKRVEQLEKAFSKAVNDLAESTVSNVKQLWQNQSDLEAHVNLIDRQVMVLINMLEANGIHVPAPSEEKKENAEPD